MRKLYSNISIFFNYGSFNGVDVYESDDGYLLYLDDVLCGVLDSNVTLIQFGNPSLSLYNIKEV